jgi:hypothetical protein
MPLTGPLTSSILPGLFSVAAAQGSATGLPVPDATMVGMYARVNDLFGEKTDLVLCSQYGANFFWQPVRPQWGRSLAGDASMTLKPLQTPSILRLTSNLSANRTLTLDKTLAYPGLQFEVIQTGTLGLFGLTLVGLALGATLSLLTGGAKRVFFDGTDYQAY